MLFVRVALVALVMLIGAGVIVVIADATKNPSYSHCQSGTRAIDTSGSIELRNASGAQRAVFVGPWGDEHGHEKIYPLLSPMLSSGEANWSGATRFDRIEIAEAFAFERDVGTALEFLFDQGFWLFQGYGLDQMASLSDVGRYNFNVIATLRGDERKSFFVGTQKPARKRFWSFRPPTVVEEKIGYVPDGAVARYMTSCVSYYGYRLYRPAVFYWRGEKLAAVAEISPEALKALKVSAPAVVGQPQP
jgi:hypothetical protein